MVLCIYVSEYPYYWIHHNLIRNKQINRTHQQKQIRLKLVSLFDQVTAGFGQNGKVWHSTPHITFLCINSFLFSISVIYSYSVTESFTLWWFETKAYFSYRLRCLLGLYIFTRIIFTMNNISPDLPHYEIFFKEKRKCFYHLIKTLHYKSSINVKSFQKTAVNIGLVCFWYTCAIEPIL